MMTTKIIQFRLINKINSDVKRNCTNILQKVERNDIVIQKIENRPLCPWACLSLAQWALSHRKNLKSWVTNCPLRTLSFDLRGI